MKCLHCLVEFHEKENLIHIGRDVDRDWGITCYDCPACKRMNLFLINGIYEHVPTTGWKFVKIDSAVAIHPRGSNRPPCPQEAPPHIAEDYKDACLVLPDSTKASAALSRRCLQNLLRDTAKVKHGNLNDEIQEVIDGGQLPSHLIEIIDAVRNIGNFGSHPTKSKNTGEILPVEPHEAEWNLDVLEALFDFYYVQPGVIAKMKASLNIKLKEAGKPPMK